MNDDVVFVQEINEHAMEFVSASDFPYQSWLGLLLRTVFLSVYSPLVVLSFLFVLGVIAKKWPHTIVKTAATILALGVIVVPSVYWFTSGSAAILSFAVAFVMVATVFILNFVKLSVLDYAIMFSCFAYLHRFIGIARSVSWLFSRFGLSLSALIVMVTILITYKTRLGQLKGNLFYCWFTCVLVFIKGFIASFLFISFVIDIGWAQDTRVEALAVWSAAVLVICGISALLIYVVKRLLNKFFDNINKMGKAYPLIERFIILNSIGIFMIMGLIHYFFGTMFVTNDPIYGFIVTRQNPIMAFTHWILLFALIFQLSFVIIIFRMTWLKDSLKITAMENQNLAAYSSSLEKSIDDIKNIKHDVKNIFLTMGNFVERSDDKEMQEFYNKKINPFAIDEIAKNDLLSKLAGLDNEQLKAFMFYKISQAVERGVSVSLDITAQALSLEYGGRFLIEHIDLVRILGILLDNAIEECVKIPDGIIIIKISGNDEVFSYMIKNTVRQKTKENGIRPGISTKGKDRGKGLIGIRSILDKYDSVLLNSYFLDDCFAQNLVVYVV